MLISTPDTSALSAAINASLSLWQRMGQLVRIQGLVKGYAGSVSVLFIFCFCHSVLNLTS